MKKKVIIVSLILITIAIAMIYFFPRNITSYYAFYTEYLGFSEEGLGFRVVEEKPILLYEFDDYLEFKDLLLDGKELPIRDPSVNSSVIYLQMKGTGTSALTYYVDNIKVQGNRIIVTLEEGGGVEISPVVDFTGEFYYVMFIEVDRTDVRAGMSVEVETIEGEWK